MSLLRPFIAGDSADPPSDLPSEFFGDRPLVYPVRVLEKRVIWQGDQPREHVLVRLSDGSESPTWEPLDVVRANFPNVLLEDKDVAIEGGLIRCYRKCNPSVRRLPNKRGRTLCRGGSWRTQSLSRSRSVVRNLRIGSATTSPRRLVIFLLF